MGLSVRDMDEMTIGLILDMLLETTYDQNGYIRNANQADFDAF
jgi:hypothetical protein